MMGFMTTRLNKIIGLAFESSCQKYQQVRTNASRPSRTMLTRSIDAQIKMPDVPVEKYISLFILRNRSNSSGLA